MMPRMRDRLAISWHELQSYRVARLPILSAIDSYLTPSARRT